MRKLSVSTIIIAVTILLGIFFVNNGSISASKPTISFKETTTKTFEIPDTVYSKTVTSNVLLDGAAVPGANISYTLVDTVNNTQELIREAITNAAGQDIVDSLPVLKHYTGIEDIKPDAYSGMEITNNGTGSNHLIRFSSNAKIVGKTGYIANLLGQQITTIPVKYNSISKTYDAVWKGEHHEKGVYIFHTASTKGTIAAKILHKKNIPSIIDQGTEIKKNKEQQNSDNYKSTTEDEAISKYAIGITHESLEDYIDTVLVQENSFHDFFFNTTGVQYADGNVFGNIFFTEGGGAPTNADVEYKQYNNQSNSFNTTAPNGMYNLQVPVIYEQGNPGQTKYIVTLTNNIDPFEMLIDTLLVSPDVNNFSHYVVQIITPPIDTVYSDIVTSTVLLNGNGFSGANISYTLLDSITGNQELIREAITNASGQDIVDSLPVLPAETGPGASQYIININHENLEDLIDTVRVQENTTHNFTFDVVEPQPDTVYSDVVTSTVSLDGNPFDGANISYTLLDSITGNQELIREAITNANGQDIVDSLPVLPAESGLGMSKYIININHSDLESLIDTVRVQENTTHNFAFNVISSQQYADGHIYGLITYTDLSGEPNSADVEYKRYLNQTSMFTTTATNGAYELDVPIVFEPLNPGQTKYIVTISENGGDPFETLIDTLLISSGNNYLDHFVNQTLPPDPEQDFEGIVRNVYSKSPESGVTVRLIDRTLGTLLQEETTSSDGSYLFTNIAQGTLVEFELGKPGELWMVNDEFDVPANITDTVATLNRYFYPKTVEVPEVGANTLIESEGEEIAEMVGPDIVNFEEILCDVDNMWDNGGPSNYWSARTFIEDNFYEGNSPITTVSTQRNITTTMQQDYDPYT